MGDTEKDERPKEYTSGQLLTGKKRFSWLKAFPVMAIVGVVGITLAFNAFAATPSANEATVRGLYQGMLCRAPSNADIKYWGGKLNSESLEKVTLTIYNTAEATKIRNAGGCHTTTSGSNNTAPTATAPSYDPTNWIKQQYRDILHREADSAGLKYWKDKMDKGMTKDEVVKALKYVAAKNTPTNAGNNDGTQTDIKKCHDHLVNISEYASYGSEAKLPTGVTIQDVADDIVRNIYASAVGSSGWDLTTEQATNSKKILNCSITPAKLAADLKASDAGKAHIQELIDHKTNVTNPINDAYMQVFLAAYAAHGSKFTVRPWILSQAGVDDCTNFMKTYKPGSGKIAPSWCFRDLDLNYPMNEYWDAIVSGGTQPLSVALAGISSGSAGLCPEIPEGSSNPFPSCENGGQFVDQTSLETAQAQVATQNGGTRPSRMPGNRQVPGSNSQDIPPVGELSNERG